MVFGLIIGIIYLFFDIFYWAKWVAAQIALRVRRKLYKRRFDLYDFDAINEPEKLGILVPEEEKKLESPFPEEQLQNGQDEIFIYGVNSKSEILLTRIMRACNDESEAWIYLKLSDGRWYELEKTVGFQRNFSDKCTSFTCGGLQMYYLEPMRRWRIIYCGMLRERKDGNETENRSVFVKFTFIWTASSEVFDASCDYDIQTTADAMAKAKWNSPFPPVHKLTESLNFYSQSGIMNGQVLIEDEPEKEMYLYGDKSRYVGKNTHLSGAKFKHLIGVASESGFVVHMGKASLPNAFENLHFGFMVHPNGHLYAIKDANIITNLSRTDAEGENIKAQFKAHNFKRGDLYELHGNFVGNRIVRYENENIWKGHMELTEIEFEIDGCKGSGFMLTGEMYGVFQAKIKRKPSLSPSNRPLTVYFTDEMSHFTDLTGGKGSSLGKLTKLSSEMESKEFIVPQGIIVTTAAYEKFLTYETIEKIEILKNIVYGNVKGNTHEACKMVSLAVENSPMPDIIVKEIEEKLNKLFNNNINQYKVAVRSSAIGEDTDQMSAAGQMDTFLGVQGLKEILTAVKKCWASQFGYIATQYKRQNGQILNSPMAVVIQEMVECEAAGVLFTCDPVTNNPSVTVISGNYGLGESVVSGSEEPDTVVLQKFPNDEIKIKSVVVGLKERRIVLTDTKASEGEEGTITEDVPEEEKNKCCISEEMALKLGKLAIKIENHFKIPRDIEWGIKHNSIYILQSRPVTTGGAVSDYEIKHEFDGPLRCENEFFTKHNVGEVMPDATSPLGMDIIHKNFTIVFQRKEMQQWQRNNFQRAKYFPSGLVPFYNHIMLNVAELITRVDDWDSVNAQSMVIGIFGQKVDDPVLTSVLKRRKYDPLKMIPYYILFLKNLFFSWYGVEQLKERVFNFQNPAESGKTSKEIFNLIMRSCSHPTEAVAQHIICLDMSPLWNMYMLNILKKARGGMDNEVYSDFAKLLATSSNVESADIPSALQDLAQSIMKDIDVNVFKAMSVEEVQEWLETSNSLAGCKYRQFIKRHGHRSLKEFDMHSLRWNLNPKPLIKILQNMSSSGNDINKKKEKDLESILPDLSVKLNFISRMLLKFLLPNCRRGVRERENCKSIMIKSIDNMGKGFQHLSKAMVSEGYLPDMNLIYFLNLHEIHELLETRNPRLIARANHRRKLFPVLDALRFPDISRGRPVPVNENQEDEKFEYVADLTMKGIPVSQGTIKGYARVVLFLNEASELKPGEILITYSTDIGWSPYFPILGGVVTELGGLISHGAVVSREYGLPCVVGLHGATKQFVTGDYVLLDGNKGILQRLSPPES